MDFITQMRIILKIVKKIYTGRNRTFHYLLKIRIKFGKNVAKFRKMLSNKSRCCSYDNNKANKAVDQEPYRFF